MNNPYESPKPCNEAQRMPRNLISNVFLVLEMIVVFFFVVGLSANFHNPKPFIDAVFPLCFVPMLLFLGAVAFQHGPEDGPADPHGSRRGSD